LEPEVHKVPEPLPPRTITQPVRTAWQSEIDTAPLLQPHTGQAAVAKPPAIRFTSPQAFMLDFGVEMYGGIRLVVGETSSHNPARVRVRFGESYTEAMSEPNQDHAIHDQWVMVPRLGSTDIGNTGFRFVRIDAVEPGVTIDLQAIVGLSSLRPLEHLGTFQCSDDRLNQIWNTGVRTVHLCMQDYLWDGIKRDRLVWVGDLHPETRVIAAVFGEHPIVPASLDFARDEFPIPAWMNGISSYSLWWIIIHRDWYWHFGRLNYLEAQRSYLQSLSDLLLKHIDGSGREKLTGMRFLDWPSSRDPAAVAAGLQSLMVMALSVAAELWEALNDKPMAMKCTAGAAKLHRHVPASPGSKQANAMMVLAGLSDAKLTNTRELAVDPLRGLSTFFGYYVLQARAKAGDFSGCLEVIRTYWGAMLDRGATTFWEEFDLGWTSDAGRIDGPTPAGKKDLHAHFGAHCYVGLRRSLCHGWAAGPTAWLTEHVLGVRPMSAGFKSASVTPRLLGLSWVRGTVPTPMGPIRVEMARAADGTPEQKIELPAGIQAIG
jgi:alpha-L-rhamnosidase